VQIGQYIMSRSLQRLGLYRKEERYAMFNL
jgi:hypothetical protein